MKIEIQEENKLIETCIIEFKILHQNTNKTIHQLDIQDTGNWELRI